jgi:hypothetical protein
MADDQGRTHKSFSEVLGALGPGGTAAIRFEDYERLFGHQPTEDEIEGVRAHQFAKDFGCTQTVDHGRKQVVFRKG